MAFDLSFKQYKEPPAVEPPQVPVTIIDLERAAGAFDMHLPMADACPCCGGFNMRVGDYVCWGVCWHCGTDE